MTREHAKELLPIITAFANGEDIQFLTEIGHWTNFDVSVRLSFDEESSRYRIAPKPRKVWVNEYKTGLALHCFNSKEGADRGDPSKARIACYELELPPLP